MSRFASSAGGSSSSTSREEEPEPAQTLSPDDTFTARITLRLPEPLKAQIEVAATADGASVNTWIGACSSAGSSRGLVPSAPAAA